ncbi:MAG: DNA-3-methyladenine glycosylase family protein, partial [Actinomycetota bacterium]
GAGAVRLEVPDVDEPGETAFATATFALDDLRDTAAAVERVRRMLDADCDPVAVADAFAGDPLIGPLVRRRPGLRVPGHVDGHEIAVRAVLGQQVSVAGARTVAAGLARSHGRPVPGAAILDPSLTHLFPDAATLTALDPEQLPMPRARGRALVALCAALADGTIALDRGADRDEVRRALLALTGIGPWTADYIALRALGHPDVFLPTDIGIRDALTGLGQDPARAADLAERWRPWRSYAQLHLWQTLTPADTEEN